MFIAALFIIAKTWKPPKCPSVDECVKKIWCIFSLSLSHTHTHTYTHTMEYYSAIKKNRMTRAATWMVRDGHTE